MRGNYGIHHIANYSSNGYYKVLQSRLKEKHLFNSEYGVFQNSIKILDRDNT